MFLNRGKFLIFIKLIFVLSILYSCGSKPTMQNYSENKNKASRLVDEGRYNKAIGICHKLLELNEKDTELYRIIAECFNKLEQADSAIFYYQGAIVFKPSDREAYERIADIHFNQGDYHSAMTWYDRALQISYISVGSYVKLAKIHQNWREYAQAMRYYNYALAGDSANIDALYGLGAIKFILGDTSSAIVLLENAALSGSHVGAAYKLGIINQQMKKYDDAVKWLDKCIEYSDDPALKERVYQRKMEIIIRMKDGQE